MPIDNSLYSQNMPDLMGAVKTGLAIRDHNDQKARQIKQDEYEGQQRKLAEQNRQVEMIARVAPSIKDQDSYNSALSYLGNNGINVGQMPAAYDPNLVNRYAAAALTAKDQADNQIKREEMASRAEDRRDAREERRALFGMNLQDRRDARADKAKLDAEKAEIANATQAKQLGLYKSGKKAEEQYLAATEPGSSYDPTASGQWIDNSEWAPNFIKDDKAITAQSAQSAWIESFLRDASGAAIPPSERGAYAKDFFPQPGDPPNVVTNKAALRQQKMENALVGAGRMGRHELANMTSETPSGAPQSSQQELAMAELMRRKQAKQTAGR